MEKSKLGFFKKLKMSIVDVDKYSILAQEKVGKTIVYLLILVLLFSVIMASIYTVEYSKKVDEAIAYFKENLPEFIYKDGKVESDYKEKLGLKCEAIYSGDIIVDLAAEDDSQYVQDVQNNKNNMIILKDKILAYDEKNQKFSEMKIEELVNSLKLEEGQTSYDKQQIFEKIESIYSKEVQTSAALFYILYIAISFFVTVLVDAIILTLIGLVFGNIVRIKFKYRPIFNMAIYSYSLSIILRSIYFAINYFTKFEIKYFDIMYTLIAYIYMIAAICIIKNDISKKRVELKDVVEEVKKQEKSIDDEVKEETTKREKKDNKDKKSGNDENNLGETPEGAHIE